MFKSMVDRVGLPLMVVDREGRIVFGNWGLEQITGYRCDALLGLNVRLLCARYESDRYLFSTLSQIKKTTEVDIDFKKKDGRLFVASVSFSPFDHEGSHYLLLTVRDVTRERVQEGRTREEKERYRRLLEERNRLQDQLNRSSQLAFMGELAAGIAHEINNPLGIILGFVQDMQDDISEDHPLFESIKIIEQETTRCVDVVKDLLDFARSKPPERMQVDLLELLEDSVSLLIPHIKKNKIQIRRAYDTGFPSIEIDPHLIRQVLLNVMINAIQAMPRGGTLRLGLGRLRRQEPKEGPNWVEIIISDTGCGIPEKDLERVFDPFFTTKGGKGTGLGLSVCQRIMDDHHGKIEIESRAGTGTTCCLYFPARG